LVLSPLDTLLVSCNNSADKADTDFVFVISGLTAW